jgi:hypothetical protein
VLALKIIGGVILLIVVVAIVLAFNIFSDPDTYR